MMNKKLGTVAKNLDASYEPKRWQFRSLDVSGLPWLAGFSLVSLMSILGCQSHQISAIANLNAASSSTLLTPLRPPTPVAANRSICATDDAESEALPPQDWITRFLDATEDAREPASFNGVNSANQMSMSLRAQELENKAVRSFASRMIVDTGLLVIVDRHIKTPRQFLELFGRNLRPGDLAQMRKLLKSVAQMPKMQREGTHLLVQQQGLTIDIDISRLSERKLAVDGVPWNIDFHQSLSSQFGILLKELRYRDPVKYGLLDLDGGRAFAAGDANSTVIADQIVGQYPDGVRVAQVGAALKAIQELPLAAKLGTTVLAVATSFLTSIAWGSGSHLETWWHDSRCSEKYGHDYNKVPATDPCTSWANTLRAQLATKGDTSDVFAMTMDPSSRRILKEFEMKPTQCLDDKKQFRGFVRSKDQNVWRYVVVDFSLVNKVGRLDSVNLYDPTLRPYFTEPLPPKFPAANQSNTYLDTNKDAECKPLDELGNICCRMTNPIYEREKLADPKTAFKTVRYCSTDLDNSQLPPELHDTVSMYKDLIPFLKLAALSCTAGEEVNKEQQASSGSGAATAPVDLTPEQVRTNPLTIEPVDIDDNSTTGIQPAQVPAQPPKAATGSQ